MHVEPQFVPVCDCTHFVWLPRFADCAPKAVFRRAHRIQLVYRSEWHVLDIVTRLGALDLEHMTVETLIVKCAEREKNRSMVECKNALAWRTARHAE